ncbi:MAG TPA: hypothetical protein VIL36_10860 [Acidimicrobiales bacterium]
MGDDTSDDGGQADLLAEVRVEMERAAGDLERVVALLTERTERVEWLEALVDELLGLLGVPAVVLDADGRVTAMSRGAEDELPGGRAVLGKPAKSVLPDALGEDVRRVALPGSNTLVVLSR